MASTHIAIIGAGRMGSALMSGWLQGRSKPEISIIDPSPSEMVKALAKDHRLGVNPEAKPADIVVVAVKPQIFEKAAPDIAAWVGPETLVVSIMAGIRIKTLRGLLGTDRIVRAMPNTPGSIGWGVSVICTPDDLRKKDIAQATRLLKPLGHVEGPVPEAQMSAVTGVSGSGPAYLFLLVEALAGAAEAEGLSPKLSASLARDTIIGAAQLLYETGNEPGRLRKNVTSKGGTTEAALDILLRGDGMPSLIREAVRAAASRERALSAGK